MCLNVKHRYTAKQALNHPWISGNAALDTNLKSTQIRLKAKWKVIKYAYFFIFQLKNIKILILESL